MSNSPSEFQVPPDKMEEIIIFKSYLDYLSPAQWCHWHNKWGDKLKLYITAPFSFHSFSSFSPRLPTLLNATLRGSRKFLNTATFRVNQTEAISPKCSFLFYGGCVSYHTGLLLFKSLSGRKRERRRHSRLEKRRQIRSKACLREGHLLHRQGCVLQRKR